MNTSQFPLYAFAALSLGVVTWMLSRWSKWFAISFLAAVTLGVVLVVACGTNVRNEHNQTMHYETEYKEGARVITLKNQLGDSFQLSNPAIVEKFEGKSGSADIRWVGWYDFGHLKKYEIQEALNVSGDKTPETAPRPSRPRRQP